MRDGYGFNEVEMCFIESWFGVHQTILHSWGDISVLLLLWQCSWGFSSVPSGKLRFLTCLIGNTELLSTKCRRIRPHLAARGKSQEFSGVAADTWCIFSSYGGDGHLKLWFFQRSGLLSSYDGHRGKLNYAWQESTDASGGDPGGHASLISWQSYIGIPINFHEESCIVTFWSIELRVPLEVSTDMRTLSRWGRHLGLSLDSPQRRILHITLSCVMKDEPAFKPLQGNPTFLGDRASQYPLYLRQQTQGPSHISIAEGRVLLWCFWKVGLLLQ